MEPRVESEVGGGGEKPECRDEGILVCDEGWMPCDERWIVHHE